jgi:SpoVK/Ycf46/Vps4 family AAA+-type ATPase
MAKLKDLKFQHPKILLWGRPGCGKTALALTLGTRAQVLDCDEGLMTGM